MDTLNYKLIGASIVSIIIIITKLLDEGVALYSRCKKWLGTKLDLDLSTHRTFAIGFKLTLVCPKIEYTMMQPILHTSHHGPMQPM